MISVNRIAYESPVVEIKKKTLNCVILMIVLQCERRSELKRDFDDNTKKQRELIQVMLILYFSISLFCSQEFSLVSSYMYKEKRQVPSGVFVLRLRVYSHMLS